MEGALHLPRTRNDPHRIDIVARYASPHPSEYETFAQNGYAV